MLFSESLNVLNYIAAYAGAVAEIFSGTHNHMLHMGSQPYPAEGGSGGPKLPKGVAAQALTRVRAAGGTLGVHTWRVDTGATGDLVRGVVGLTGMEEGTRPSRRARKSALHVPRQQSDLPAEVGHLAWGTQPLAARLLARGWGRPGALLRQGGDSGGGARGGHARCGDLPVAPGLGASEGLRGPPSGQSDRSSGGAARPGHKATRPALPETCWWLARRHHPPYLAPHPAGAATCCRARGTRSSPAWDWCGAPQSRPERRWVWGAGASRGQGRAGGPALPLLLLLLLVVLQVVVWHWPAGLGDVPRMVRGLRFVLLPAQHPLPSALLVRRQTGLLHPHFGGLIPGVLPPRCRYVQASGAASDATRQAAALVAVRGSSCSVPARLPCPVHLITRPPPARKLSLPPAICPSLLPPVLLDHLPLLLTLPLPSPTTLPAGMPTTGPPA